MLQLTEEFFAKLRMENGRALARQREKMREKMSVRQKGRQLSSDRLQILAKRTARILDAGVPTKFEFEGACRRGLRIAFIRQGWSWQDAENAAIAILDVALKLIGAERPSWNDGQPEAAANFRADRYFCSRCGSIIDQDRKTNGTPAKYCSFECGNAARVHKSRISGERVSMAARLAQLAERSAKTVAERSGICEQCSMPFITDTIGRRFCSMTCSGASRRKNPERQCAVCETRFYSKDENARFCSRDCGNASRRKPRPVVQCETCQTVFFALRAAKNPRYCSRTCVRPTGNNFNAGRFNCEETT